MSLIRLVYASRFCESKFDTQELAKIHKTSQKNNKESEITGSLIFGDDFFLQCLEGDREVVSRTYNKIAGDPRHDSVTLISMENIIRRDFSEWQMKFVLLTHENSNIIQEFSGSSKFNPFTMQSQNALELMKVLSK